MNRGLGKLVWFLAVVVLAIVPAWMYLSSASARPTEVLGLLPVQDGGRMKPLETLARESLQLVYNSREYKTPQGDSRPALEVVMTWMLVPQYWDQQAILEISHKAIKKSLNLPDTTKFYSPAEILNNPRLTLVMQELGSFRETKEKLTPYFQAVQRLESQLATYQAFREGRALRVVPPTPDHASDRWLAVSELEGDLQKQFSILMRSFIQSLPSEDKDATQDAQSDPTVPELKDAMAGFMELAAKQNPEIYPTLQKMEIETHYVRLHPFMVTWILYLVAAIFLGVAWQGDRPTFYMLGWGAVVAAFLLHTYGFGLRMYLTGRPPVSNMYESVIWVSWGTLLFAMIFEWMNKKKFILTIGALVGVLCLIVADLAPTILDPSLQPLEPVLRSNMWLTVHVLTITLSYSAFFLAWGLGVVGLFFILKGDQPTADRPRAMTLALYRSLQIGVVLLAAGTILGGVWADYSWGRFWGWDPKETWALIALLGYLAILHARLVGLLKNFGMMLSSVLAFILVVMAWYGVNFVLGAGLHSYGFGAGGVQYMAAFVILNLIYVGYVSFIRMARDSK